ETEPQARAAYEFFVEAAVTEVGFVLHPTHDFAGCSPDGLVGDDGMVEIKAPNTATHIDTLLGETIPEKYLKQMHWQMACCGRQWCDFVSFDPRLPATMQLYVQRVPRDDIAIAEIENAVRAFDLEIVAKVSALTAKFASVAA
ncbi:MAG TPA: YqaJ viral recombinase family protein, partial [Nitrospira sp.]